MPTREEALNEFFRSFRSSMNMLSLYSHTHPFFAESVKDLKSKTDALLLLIGTLKISITSDSILVDGKPLDKTGLYNELTTALHRRKVKNIEIRSGVSTEELIVFLSKIHLSSKQILASGGLEAMLKKENINHVSVEDLDYSQLLREGGEECKDIWSYLLKEAVDQKDSKKISEFADNASAILSSFKVKDFVEDKELKNNITGFLNYLKDHHKDKFDKFAKEMLKVTLKDKTVSDKGIISQVKVFLKDLSEHDFADTVSEEILKEKDFDTLTFNLFSQLADENRHQTIASSLKDKIKNNESLLGNVKMRQRIEKLFAIPSASSVSEIYRNTLQSLVKDIAFNQGTLSFDREHLRLNFRLILLNIFDAENNREKLKIAVNMLDKELGQAIKDKETEYLKFLVEILKKRKKDEPYLIDLFLVLDERIANFAEDSIDSSDESLDSEYFIEYLSHSVKGDAFYLDKIFLKEQLNPKILKIFLKLFSFNLDNFYARLKTRYADLDFLGNLVNSLRSIGSEPALEILKKIYPDTNNMIKVEILRAMLDFKECDQGFLFAILQKADPILRREAMAILAKFEKSRASAVEVIFSKRSLFGRNKGVILENIRILDELKINEARPYLISLSQKRFFWNRDIKNSAREVLRRWDAG